nr:helicase, C-terminal [Tanacetum cinerariifolium]
MVKEPWNKAKKFLLKPMYKRKEGSKQKLITAPTDNRFRVDVGKNWVESSKVFALLHRIEMLVVIYVIIKQALLMRILMIDQRQLLMSGLTIAAISVVFDHAEFEDVFQTCIDGLYSAKEPVLAFGDDVKDKMTTITVFTIAKRSTSLVFFQLELLVMQLMILSFLLNQFDSNKRDFNFTVGMFGSNRHYANTVSSVSEKAIIVVEVEPLVKDFASRWKAAVELMHVLQLRG